MNITEDDFARMSWYARQRYFRRIRAEIKALSEPEPDAFDELGVVVPIDRPKRKRGKREPRRIRVYKVGPSLWEMTDGLNTVRTSNAATAWSLIRRLGGQR